MPMARWPNESLVAKNSANRVATPNITENRLAEFFNEAAVDVMMTS